MLEMANKLVLYTAPLRESVPWLTRMDMVLAGFPDTERHERGSSDEAECGLDIRFLADMEVQVQHRYEGPNHGLVASLMKWATDWVPPGLGRTPGHMPPRITVESDMSRQGGLMMG
jgi:hypothetical protein